MTRPTEEQIKAALHAWNWQSTGVSENEAMKRALTAALSVPVQGEVGEIEAVARAICGVAFPGAEDHTDYKGEAKWKEFIPEAEAVLRARSARPVGVPDGWQLVPKKMTPKMRRAGLRASEKASHGNYSNPIYEAQIAAAPALQRKEGWTMEGQERRWWAYGHYNGQDCPKCGRERMMVCTDNDGTERTICEKCNWEPAANSYLSEA